MQIYLAKKLTYYFSNLQGKKSSKTASFLFRFLVAIINIDY